MIRICKCILPMKFFLILLFLCILLFLLLFYFQIVHSPVFLKIFFLRVNYFWPLESIFHLQLSGKIKSSCLTHGALK